MGEEGLTAIIIRDEKAKAIHMYPNWNLLSVNLRTVEDLPILGTIGYHFSLSGVSSPLNPQTSQ